MRPNPSLATKTYPVFGSIAGESAFLKLKMLYGPGWKGAARAEAFAAGVGGWNEAWKSTKAP